jgi:DNA-binding HxlR family transcriptional regulator
MEPCRSKSPHLEKARWPIHSASLDGIAPTTLSERLRALEQNGVVERRFYSMSPPRAEYVLTEKGRDLGPIVGAMRNWGRKYSR